MKLNNWLLAGVLTTSVSMIAQATENTSSLVPPEGAVLNLDDPQNATILENSSALNTAPSYNEKALSLAFTTGNDVVSRQTLYEQGGGWRGLNMYIENNQLHMNVWSINGELIWGYKTVSANIQPNHDYSAIMVMDGGDAQSGSLLGYINGQMVGQEQGVGVLLTHNNGIGIGDTNARTTFAGQIDGDSYPFVGTIEKVLQYNDVLNPEQIAQLNEYLAATLPSWVSRDSEADEENKENRDEVYQAALTIWRNNDVEQHPKGSCAGCHGGDFFDLARIGTTSEDTIRRAIIDGATPEQAEIIAQAIDYLREDYNLPETNAREFRPFQPGGEVLLPDITGDRHEVRVRRDVAFGESLKTYLPTWFGERIDSLAMAEQAKEEMLDLARGTNLGGSNPDLLTLRDLPVGIEYPLWSADLHHGAEEGTFNDWVSDLAFEPKAGLEDEWYAIQDAYFEDPSDFNFYKMYVASLDMLEMTNLPDCLVNPDGRSCEGQKSIFRNKFVNAMLGQHMLRVEALGRADEFRQGANAFAHLDNDPDYAFLISDRKHGHLTIAEHLWGVGRDARRGIASHSRNGEFQKLLELQGHKQFVVDSVDANRPGFREHHTLRSVWTWIGFTHEPSLNRLGRGATKTGEYSHASYRSSNLHIHSSFQQNMRLLAQGFIEESNRGRRTSSDDFLRQGTTRFHMHYQHFIDGNVWNGLRQHEDRRWEDTQPLPQEVKDQQKALWDQLTSSGFRMSMYLYQKRMNDTGTIGGKVAVNSIGKHLARTDPEHNAADSELLQEVVAQHIALGGSTKN